ncbi:unnamed protein product, partial [Choristocarpus tenellus]
MCICHLITAAERAHIREYGVGEAMTQEILQLMRRSGIIAGVNQPSQDEIEPPQETQTFLFLQLKKRKGADKAGALKDIPGIEMIAEHLGPCPPHRPTEHRGDQDQVDAILVAGSLVSNLDIATDSTVKSFAQQPQLPTIPKMDSMARTKTRGLGRKEVTFDRMSRARGRKKGSGAFEVDLLRFRSIEEIIGEQGLGHYGGEGLAVDLAAGACPRLTILRLGRCGLRHRGLNALLCTFMGGAGGRSIRELDLRANGFTGATGAGMIGEALARGALPALQDLNLSGNLFGDEGGKLVAHQILSGNGKGWSRLIRLDLSANGMHDIGVEAMYKALTTCEGKFLAPAVKRISL